MKTVYSLLADQYQNISKESASQLDKAKIIIILDDFQQLKGSGEGRSKFIHNINGVFNHVIITGKSQIFFEPITTTNKEFVDAFGDYTQLSITEFGKDLRYKLIDKWNKIGRIDEVPLNDILRMNDEVMRKMDSIIGKNYLPPYPIYLLTIIQSMETVAVNNPDYSLQGYYYDYLISDSINKAIADKETISFYYNFIAEYVFHLFKQKIRVKPVSRETFEKFYRNYKDVYQINISLENIIVNLVKTRIITVDENSNFAITYNYIYYFFIAKYLSSKIHLEETKVLIREMCGKLYREEYSNIILFLVHLSGDPIVLNEIQVVAKGIFPDQPICKLDVDVHKINGMIERMPDQVIELMDVEKAREAEYQHQTEIETSIKDEAKENANYDSDLEENPVDIIGQIFFAFKTIDILGQVTKKHWGDLPGPRKLELAEETYLLGLRTLNAYLKALGESSVILAEHIKFLIESKHIKDRDKIEQFSKNFIFRMSFMASYGIIKRISNAIGYSKLNITFDELLNKLRCPSVELIDLSIKLDHFKSFPMDDVERIKGATHQKNYLAFLILKNLVMNYLYLFDTTIGTKQKLESLVGIKITNSLLIDNTSNVKR
jgi:hypothetical protein